LIRGSEPEFRKIRPWHRHRQDCVLAKDKLRPPAATSNAAAGNLSADSLKAHIDRMRSPQHEKANACIDILGSAPSVPRD
jgi:hypothetical protein